jgi:hypothetical protein
MTRMKRISIGLAGCLCLVLVAAGCGGSQDAVSGTLEVEEEAAAPEPDVTVEVEETDSDEAGFSMEVSEEGGFTIESDGATLSAGMAAKLPEGLPEDVPVPQDVQVQASTSDPDAGEFSYTGRMRESLDDAAAFFDGQAQAAGWTLTTNIDTANQMRVRTYEKEGRTLSVTLTNAEVWTSLVVAVTESDA